MDSTDFDHKVTHLLEAPDIKPEIRTWKYQWMGMLFLISIPFMALLGFFGEKMGEKLERINDIEISLEYPERMRLGQTEYLRFKISNKSDKDLKNISLKLNHNYLKNFHEFESLPSLDDNLEIPVGDISQHTDKHAYLKIKANDFGLHHAKLSLKHLNTQMKQLEFKTLVFP